jgi:hypothetical protein
MVATRGVRVSLTVILRIMSAAGVRQLENFLCDD